MKKRTTLAEKISNMKQASHLAVECMNYVLTLLKVGVSEKEIELKIKQWFLDHGASGNSFKSIVAFEEGAATPHHVPNKKRLLKENDLVLIDIGCVYNGWCSDITRTFLPKNASQEKKDIYKFVLHANKLGISEIKESVLMKELHQRVVEYFKTKEVDKYFIHSLGHQIGRTCHAGGRYAKDGKTRIEGIKFFTIEPGLYLPNKFGVRIEDLIYFNNGKIEVLTKDSPKEIVYWN